MELLGIKDVVSIILQNVWHKCATGYPQLMHHLMVQLVTGRMVTSTSEVKRLVRCDSSRSQQSCDTSMYYTFSFFSAVSV